MFLGWFVQQRLSITAVTQTPRQPSSAFPLAEGALCFSALFVACKTSNLQTKLSLCNRRRQWAFVPTNVCCPHIDGCPNHRIHRHLSTKPEKRIGHIIESVSHPKTAMRIDTKTSKENTLFRLFVRHIDRICHMLSQPCTPTIAHVKWQPSEAYSGPL